MKKSDQEVSDLVVAQVMVRVSPDLKDKLNEYCKSVGVQKSPLVRIWIIEKLKEAGVI